ncbi:MAG TPA: M23 family metallopeptidase [Bacillota bacterium]|nr:M23 family metallopeptidase [Bacillota bacterium]
MARFIRVMLLTILFLTGVNPSMTYAKASAATDLEQERFELFQKFGQITGIPWYYLAAMNQYEKNIAKFSTKPGKKQKDASTGRQLLSIDIPSELWGGMLNPDQNERNVNIIQFFDGLGRDGNGDHQADRHNDMDVLFSIASYLGNYGYTEDDIRIGLWEYYHMDKAVDLISEYAQIYQAFHTLKLSANVFPLPLHSDYSYRSTWGSARGYGGRRMHEGCDLFANYGTPVRSVCYGYIEVRGWNRFGGWRVGIRDLNNVYHYYAHLGGFNKKLKVGDIVKPGDVVGWVGSSGYGKPGTSGKFPPHLHYGMYKFNGKTEWAFDPFPHLNKWEREEARNKKKR